MWKPLQGFTKMFAIASIMAMEECVPLDSSGTLSNVYRLSDQYEMEL